MTNQQTPQKNSDAQPASPNKPEIQPGNDVPAENQPAKSNVAK